MSSREFARWQAFDQVSPIGAERLDSLAAHVLATIVAHLTGKDQRTDKHRVRWNAED